MVAGRDRYETHDTSQLLHQLSHGATECQAVGACAYFAHKLPSQHTSAQAGWSWAWCADCSGHDDSGGSSGSGSGGSSAQGVPGDRSAQGAALAALARPPLRSYSPGSRRGGNRVRPVSKSAGPAGHGTPRALRCGGTCGTGKPVTPSPLGRFPRGAALTQAVLLYVVHEGDLDSKAG